MTFPSLMSYEYPLRDVRSRLSLWCRCTFVVHPEHTAPAAFITLTHHWPYETRANFPLGAAWHLCSLDTAMEQSGRLLVCRHTHIQGRTSEPFTSQFSCNKYSNEHLHGNLVPFLYLSLLLI